MKTLHHPEDFFPIARLSILAAAAGQWPDFSLNFVPCRHVAKTRRGEARHGRSDLHRNDSAVVRGKRTGFALAQDPGSVCGLVERNHPAADANRTRAGILGAVHAAFPECGIPCRRFRGRDLAALAGPGLLQPRPKSPCRRPSNRRHRTLPDTVEDLRSLKGVGEYTAAGSAPSRSDCPSLSWTAMSIVSCHAISEYSHP